MTSAIKAILDDLREQHDREMIDSKLAARV